MLLLENWPERDMYCRESERASERAQGTSQRKHAGLKLKIFVHFASKKNLVGLVELFVLFCGNRPSCVSKHPHFKKHLKLDKTYFYKKLLAKLSTFLEAISKIEQKFVLLLSVKTTFP